MEITESAPVKGFGWRSLLNLAALGNLVVLLFMALTQGDTLALALIGVILVGLALSRFRSGLFGFLLLGLIFADITLWTVSGAVNNLVHGERGLALLLPSLLGIISLTGMAAAVGAVISRRREHSGSRFATWLGAASLVLVLLAGLTSLLLRPPAAQAAPGTEIVLGSKNMVYSSSDLLAGSRDITLTLANEDLWWHTFTIDELGLDLQVPMGAERSVTFQAPPGEYRFYCGIPGHESIGMHGTLTVTGEASQP